MECVSGCLDAGVRIVTLYAFSTENWQRPIEEVNTLMGLLERFLKEYTKDMQRRGIRLEAIGRLDELPKACRCQLETAVKATAENEKLTTILAINYSGRTEIIDAVRQLAYEAKAGRLDPEAISPDLFRSYLYTSAWPDPDLLIRTSGEMRISNFLLWQVSYTEMYVTKKLWPDFKKEDLFDAIEEYGKRQRRYGGV
jgi:undecaprenyl diphosphate synthase